MNFIEALKSGRPFRRINSQGKKLLWNGPTGRTEWIEKYMLTDFHWLTMECLLANDFEIKSEPLEVPGLVKKVYSNEITIKTCVPYDLEGKSVRVRIEVVE